MRRAPAVVLVLMLVLAGCGEQDTTSSAPPTTDEPATTTSTTTTVPLPDLRHRPKLLLAVQVDGGTDLLTLEGTAFAHLPGVVPHWHDDATHLIVAHADHRRFEVHDDGTSQAWTQVQGDLAKDEPPPPAVGPQGQFSGHWRARWTSPDGRARLGYWSGECESPTAWFSDAGGPWRPVIEGIDGWPLESRALGWTTDGRAIVSFTDGLCGTGIQEPGTYLVDLDGTSERIAPQADALWRR